MKKIIKPYFALAVSIATLISLPSPVYAVGNAEPIYEAVEKGSNNGRMLRQNDFAIELAIFEEGVPPEFRIWASSNGNPIDLSEVKVEVVLDRLGDVKDNIGFYQQENYLRGNMAIYEPHSFAVELNAQYKGKTYRWAYDNFEGRVNISNDIARLNGIETQRATAKNIKQIIKTYGKLIYPIENTRNIVARFDGIVKKVHVGLGQRVNKGEALITVESNQGLNAYTITSPIEGVITGRYINEGEQTESKILLRLANNRKLVAELNIFPKDRSKIQLGNLVKLHVDGAAGPIEGVINYIGSEVLNNQGFPIRVEIDNNKNQLSAGSFVTAEITVAVHQALLSVKRDGIQAFRDFQVVYAKVGETYEVRMLELGVQSGEWAEVLSGLPAGTEYVTENSYVVKADIDKSAASHDH